MSEPHLRVETHDHVAVVTMNRPEARNAWTLEMLARMADAWEAIDADPGVRVAVLTGAGGAFCAGSDLKAMHGDRSGDPYFPRFQADPDLHWKAMLRHYTLTKPLIAAVEGVAVAGGTEILQATDIRVAAASAKFGLTEAKWALFPVGGSTVRLQRQIPFVHAMEMLLTADVYSADDALRMGLISRVVPDGTALDVALQLARKVASNGPLAVQAIKRSARATAGMSEADGLALELELGMPIFATEDAREGPRAFKERRAPEFKGR